MTQVCAHRGARREAPENMLPVFELIIAQGSDGVELACRFHGCAVG